MTNTRKLSVISKIIPLNGHDLDFGFPVIDVRSPGEYAQGHIPGAVNIPLFTDHERAEIGTLYVKKGRDQAVARGLDMVLPRTGQYLTELKKTAAGEKRVAVYCWRGGMRSESMANLFSRAGFEVHIITGGYKAYRRMIREQLSVPMSAIVVGGYTGSGKTELLHHLSLLGEQVIDLEMLARHKGSVFGALGQQSQPTNEQFENDLFGHWRRLAPERVVWIEDESRMIGTVTLPDAMVRLISGSPMVMLVTGWEERIGRLVNEYAGFDKALLAESVNRIRTRLGGAQAQEALAALETGDFRKVAAIALQYYDKAYRFAVDRRSCRQIREIGVHGSNLKEAAKKLVYETNLS